MEDHESRWRAPHAKVWRVDNSGAEQEAQPAARVSARGTEWILLTIRVVRTGLLLACVCLLWSSSAAASSPASKASPTAWERRPFALSLAASPWGSPTGVLGVTADYAIEPWFSVAGGVGLGGIVYHGPKGGPTPLFAVSGRYRALGDRENAATLAVGLSTGPYAYGTYCIDCEPYGNRVWTWNLAYWSDFSIGYERRTESGSSFQFNAGAEYLLNSSSEHCYVWGASYTPCSTHKILHHIIFPFVQFTWGVAF